MKRAEWPCWRRMSGLLGLLLASSLALAEGKLSYGREGAAPSQFLEIGANAVRMSQAGQGQWMLYRDQDRTLYIVDDSQRSYQKVDAALVKSLKQQISRMQAQIEAQLAALPPEQRQMMQGMMPRMPDFEQGNYSVKLGKDKRQAAGYSCRPLVVMQDDTPVEEMCLAAISELKLSKSDLALLERMGKTMGELAASFGAGSMAAVMEAKEGIPVEHRDPGAPHPRSVLLEVEPGAQPAERFSLPEGYKPQPLFPGLEG